jgi:hypothetical protein
MPTVNRASGKQLDPARSRLIQRAIEMRMGLKELSLRIGKNPSYVQQFVMKGSPRALPEAARRAIAELLLIDETELREGGADAAQATAVRPGVVSRPPPSAALLALAPTPSGRRIPLFREGEGRISAALSSAERIGMDDFGSAHPSAVGVALAEPRGLLQPRHVLLCEPGQPARPGDVVLVLVTDVVAGAGVLLSATREAVTWMEGSDQRQADRLGVTIWRVAAIRTQ